MANKVEPSWSSNDLTVKRVCNENLSCIDSSIVLNENYWCEKNADVQSPSFPVQHASTKIENDVQRFMAANDMCHANDDSTSDALQRRRNMPLLIKNEASSYVRHQLSSYDYNNDDDYSLDALSFYSPMSHLDFDPALEMMTNDDQTSEDFKPEKFVVFRFFC